MTKYGNSLELTDRGKDFLNRRPIGQALEIWLNGLRVLVAPQEGSGFIHSTHMAAYACQ